jgi:hypothetical protein
MCETIRGDESSWVFLFLVKGNSRDFFFSFPFSLTDVVGGKGDFCVVMGMLTIHGLM